jgi:hypothetical protein
LPKLETKGSPDAAEFQADARQSADSSQRHLDVVWADELHVESALEQVLHRSSQGVLSRAASVPVTLALAQALVKARSDFRPVLESAKVIGFPSSELLAMPPLVTCAPATYASNLIEFFLPPAEANMD